MKEIECMYCKHIIVDGAIYEHISLCKECFLNEDIIAKKHNLRKMADERYDIAIQSPYFFHK